MAAAIDFLDMDRLTRSDVLEMIGRHMRGLLDHAVPADPLAQCCRCGWPCVRQFDFEPLPAGRGPARDWLLPPTAPSCR